MLVKKKSFVFVFILLSLFLQQITHAQCTSPIISFPYDEDFEASDGNWVRSSATHWEWGQIISKPLITAAGGGVKCWLVGGFSSSTYASGSSYLQSPCFDISSLSDPEISFKIFWETERKYDGVLLQYTVDGGVSWQILGSMNSNTNCQGVNWYNYNPVSFLFGPGWSGNIQSTSGSCVGGGGSGGWLTARHSLAVIAGATGVTFRFVFGAGSTCNDFDGFAIDDIHIDEAQPNGANFTYTCTGNNTAAFASTVSGCKTGVSWDFGDIASGVNNSSVLDNPTHIFSSPGNYNVNFTTNFVSGPSLTIAKSINVIAATTSITNPVKCNGDQTGAITVNVNPAGIYNYSWDTNPVQSTPSISNLTAGIYTVTITGTNTCSISLPVTITEPPTLNLTTRITDAKCGMNNGSINSTVTAGTPPYTYNWSTTATTPSINNLAPGIYSLQLTDANGCTANANNLQVNNDVNNITVSLGTGTDLCPGQTLVLDPGNFAAYKWQDNSTSPTFTVTTAGIYSVTVTDNAGCTGFASVKITGDCLDIYFPSAFTPNKDNWNDSFGPLGTLSSLRNYKLVVYGRWGEILFSSTDPYKKWDGTYKGKPQGTGVYVWTATYTINNLMPVTQNGTITIFR